MSRFLVKLHLWVEGIVLDASAVAMSSVSTLFCEILNPHSLAPWQPLADNLCAELTLYIRIGLSTSQHVRNEQKMCAVV